MRHGKYPLLAAFRLPNLVRRIVGEGGLNPALVPALARLGPDDQARMAGETLSLFGLALLALAGVVQIAAGQKDVPNIKKLLGDTSILKIMHFARFDVGILFHSFGVMPAPLYCTKIASRLARTYTDKHGLKDLAREVLGIDLSKQQQLTDWGAAELTDAQIAYAATDVLHLHALKEKLDAMLLREGRTDLAQACFRFLPDRVRLDLSGWAEQDIFSHSS
jgi:ribonuclease D